ncbi:MAG: RDD family protein [Acidobacteriota bacterium]
MERPSPTPLTTPQIETAHDAVLGLDNVRLGLPLAGLGSRGLATFVDHLLALLGIAIWGLGVLSLFNLAGLSGPWAVALFLIGAFLIQWGYFAACELTMDGQTPGKRALGLRTVSSVGGRASSAAILLRNLLRSLDLAVGVPIMALDTRSRRLGDLVASTLVVHHRGERDGAPSLGRVPDSWTGRDVAVVESLLGRAHAMEPERARRMAEQVNGWLRRREPDFIAGGEAEWADDAPAPDDPLVYLSRILAAEV